MNVQAVVDRLSDLVTGLGTAKAKSYGLTWALNEPTYADLLNEYRGNWIAKKVVDIPPFDMVREWRTWQADDAAIEAIEAEEKRLGIRRKALRALTLARWSGGAALYLGDGGDPAEELRTDTLGRGGLRTVLPLSRFDLSWAGGQVDMNIESPNFGMPTVWQLSVGTGTPFIHPSRLIIFRGNERPDSLRRGGDPWGDSVLIAIDDALKQAQMSSQVIADLLMEAKIDVIKIPNLSEHLATTEGTNRLTARFQTAARVKSMAHALMLDKEEEWDTRQLTFASMPDVLLVYMQLMSGAADIPMTRLMSQSPAGLNSTGESDIRNYYDRISADQELDLRPQLERLDAALIPSALGSMPSDIHFEFGPLWQTSEKENAEIAEKHANAWSTLVNTAIIPDVVAQHGLKNQMIESGVYPGIEAAYEDFEAGTLEPIVPAGEGREQEEAEGVDPGMASEVEE